MWRGQRYQASIVSISDEFLRRFVFCRHLPTSKRVTMLSAGDGCYVECQNLCSSGEHKYTTTDDDASSPTSTFVFQHSHPPGCHFFSMFVTNVFMRTYQQHTQADHLVIQYRKFSCNNSINIRITIIQKIYLCTLNWKRFIILNAGE